MKKLMVIALFVSVGLNAFADTGWHHASPIQSGDVSALMDFQVENTVPGGGINGGGPSSYQLSADPLWINIRRAGLGSQDHVHVMIINFRRELYRGEDYGVSQDVIEQDLSYVEPNRFAGRLPSIVFGFQLNDGYAVTTKYYWQELVIWINGRIYKDPVSGRNLRFTLANVRGERQR